MHKIFGETLHIHSINLIKNLLIMGLLPLSRNTMPLFVRLEIHDIDVKIFAIYHSYIQIVTYQKLELRRFLGSGIRLLDIFDPDKSRHIWLFSRSLSL